MTDAERPHPLKIFSEWYSEAQDCQAIPDASAMTLCTSTPRGAPSSRIVLLKGIDQESFIFYTNLNSRKSQELKENPACALTFFWPQIGRQVRVEGQAELTSDVESDAYFAIRPRDSQVGAWASLQSETLDERKTLKDAFAKYDSDFKGDNVPRPPHWGGWRILPTRIEFWEQRPHRLHFREVFIRRAAGWDNELLYP